MSMRLLAVNVGSSSLKLSLVEDGRLLAAENLPFGDGGRLDEKAMATAATSYGKLDGTVHRVVHGGSAFTEAVTVDGDVRRRLERLVELAPLHMAPALAGIDLFASLLPGLPIYACFDTAFHANLPVEAATYALPSEWQDRWGLRRYGFHGLSHAWAASRTAVLAGERVDALRIVTCHLGSGASLAAVQRGRSVDTTMGFTPLEGLVMGTRAGNVDPGLLLFVAEQAGLTPGELGSALEHRSGLLALAGTAEMREVLEKEAGGSDDAALALAVYLHRLRGGIAAMASAMGGLDALTFTGGVGEHAPAIRRRAAEQLAFLGIGLEETANAAAVADCEISGRGARVRTFVVAAREDLQMAAEVRKLRARAEASR